jgi:monoamine oxidase
MQSPLLNAGKPVEQRQVIHDTRGYLAIEAKLDASRAAMETLHPGRSQLLEKPIYVSWAKNPYSLGCFATTGSRAARPATANWKKPEGRTYFAGDYLSHLVAWQEGAVLSAHHTIDRIATKMKS